jgi:hypothetical protein
MPETYHEAAEAVVAIQQLILPEAGSARLRTTIISFDPAAIASVVAGKVTDLMNTLLVAAVPAPSLKKIRSEVAVVAVAESSGFSIRYCTKDPFVASAAKAVVTVPVPSTAVLAVLLMIPPFVIFGVFTTIGSVFAAIMFS